MRKQRLLIPVLILAAAGLAAFGGRAMASYAPAPPAVSPSAAPTASARLKAAWRNAQTVGEYAYSTEVAQTTHPTARFENQGLSSKRDTFRIDGATDLAAQTMSLKIWSGAGSVDAPGEALEIKVANGKALGRSGNGAWRELEESTALFAPDNDPLTYLVAARNVTAAGAETRAETGISRYTFDLDGVAFAEHMRGRMEDELRRKGKLPPQFNMALLGQYVDMTGAGEVWVTDDGLPVRQVVRLTFPPRGLEWVDAEITTDFSDWGAKRLALGGAGSAETQSDTPAFATLLNAAAAADLSRAMTLAAAAVGMGALLIVLTRFGGSRRVYRGVAIALIGAMLCGPLLQTQQAAAFIDDQHAQKVLADDRRADDAQRQELQAALNANDFDPMVAPLGVADQQAEAARQLAGARGERDAIVAAPAATPEAGQSVAYVGCLRVSPSDDPDKDGLTNIQEESLGTDPCNADSDGDDLPDGEEVVGFDVGVRRFYSDPVSGDSDRDGIPDGLECNVDALQVDAAKTSWAPGDLTSPYELWRRQSNLNPGAKPLACVDTDKDGVPDVWDDDSDGDGAPDSVDLSPTTVVAGAFNADGSISGFANQTFKLNIDNPSAEKPLVVELQLRPANPDHLFLRQNVLAWAVDDRKGQVQSVLSPKYGNSGRDANGNMRLTPMLEIQVRFENGRYGGLPVKKGYAGVITAQTPTTVWLDSAALADYGISVKGKDSSGNLVVYSPINIVRDSVGTAPVGFSATMLYRPKTAASFANEVRLVWLVQALLDYCDTADAPKDEDYDQWCAGRTHWKTGGNSTIHAYYDDWYLTGMSAREDLGVNVGIVFESPAVAVSRPFTAADYYEDKLWGMADRLERGFMAGLNDLTINDIRSRFDISVTSTMTPGDARLWGFDRQTFRVMTYALESQSMIGVVAMTHTRDILRQYFDPFAGSIDAPTLLIAREETFRAAAQSGSGRITANQDRFDLAESVLPSQTLASLSWAPFLHRGAGVWEPYPIAPYIDRLHERLKRAFKGDAVLNADQYAFTGALFVADSIYAARFAGTSAVVRVAGQVVAATPPPLDADLKKLAGTIVGVGGLAGTLIKEFAQQRAVIEALGGSANGVSAYLHRIGKGRVGQNLGGNVAKVSRGLSWPGKASTASGTDRAAAGIVVGLAASFLTRQFGGKNGEFIGDIMQSSLMVVIAANALKGAVKVRKAWNAAKNLPIGPLTAAGKQFMTKAAKGAAVVGLLVEVGAGVAMFFAETANARPGSQAYDQAVVNLVATIIVAVIMVAIAFIPIIGGVILAVVALLDAVADLICKAMGIKADPNGNSAKDWLCSGLSGLLAKAIGKFIFSSNPIVNMDDNSRRQIGGLQQQLKDPALGFQQGNEIRVGFTVTSELVANEPNSWMAEIYGYHYTSKYIKQTAMVYALQLTNADIHDGLETDYQKDYWRWNGAKGRYFMVANPSATIRFARAGINQATAVRLAEGYDINLQKCVYVIFSVACWLTDKSDTNAIPLADMEYDVFPPTFDQFYAMTARGASFALAWDARFPTLCDADGDGLRSNACGGGDPNDSDPDSDSDGLSDFDEVVTFHSNPSFRDTDGDGLTDYQEARFNTNPLQADSDGDGLLDCEEVAHPVLAPDNSGVCGAIGTWSGGWSFLYAFDAQNQPLRTQVMPNPVSLDIDGDAFSDGEEKLYGFNPAVFSRSDIMGISAEVYENGVLSDGMVKPGQTITYTARLENNLLDRFGLGLLDVAFPAAASSVDLLPKPFVLLPGRTITLPGSVSVNPAIVDTQRLSLTNQAGAEITNLYADADRRRAWLHFEESPGATLFADGSGRGNKGTCVVPCPVAGVAGYLGSGAHFGGASSERVTLGTASTLGLYDSSFTVVAWISMTDYVGNSADPASVLSIAPNFQGSAYLNLFGGYPGFSSAYSYRRCVNYLVYQDCSTVPVYQELTAPTRLSLKKWHQVAFRYSKILKEMTIFIDGRADAVLVGVEPLRLSGSVLAGNQFRGDMDELEIFAEALSDADIGARTTAPVLHLKFDGTFADSSPNRQPAPTIVDLRYNDGGLMSINRYQPSAAPGGGRLGGAVQFTQWPSWWPGNSERLNTGFSEAMALAYAPNSSLDLSGGQFAQAFWIKPDVLTGLGFPSAPESRRIGILGANTTSTDYEYRYPFVELVAPEEGYEYITYSGKMRVRVGFSRACAAETDFIVPDKQWSHLAVSYNAPNYKVYLNGALAGDLTLQAPCDKPGPLPSSALLVGRSRGRYGTTATPYARFWELPNYAGRHYDVAMDTSFYQTTNETAAFAVQIGKSIQLFGACVTLRLGPGWSGPGSEICQNTPDLLNVLPEEIRYIRSLVALTPRARAFNGALDDVRIYRNALSDAEVADLYSSARRVELSLDEAPGATRFRDNTLADNTFTCAVNRCPVSGVAGRVNEAARFDGVNDVLESGAGAAIAGTGPFGVAAWVRTSSAATQVIATQRSASAQYRDYALELANGRVRWISSSGSTSPSFDWSSNRTVNDGKWHHVLAVRDGAGAAGKIYIDGVLDSSRVSSGSPRSFGGGAVAIGGDPWSNTAFFDGLIDNVMILNSAPSAAEIGQLLGESPDLSLHLDDAAGARVFADASERGIDGACFGAGCPRVGAAGKVRGAASFDGIDDRITVPYTNAVNLDAYSIGMWVRPEQLRSGSQPLIARGGGQEENCLLDRVNNTRNFYLSLEPMSTTVRFLMGAGANRSCWTTPDSLAFNIVSKKGLNLNRWNHVMATFDDNVATLYINGVRDASGSGYGASSQKPWMTTAPVEIGDVLLRATNIRDGVCSSPRGCTEVAFAGQMDEIVIYPGALSAQAIRKLYDNQFAWFNFSTETRIVIDADKPEAMLDLHTDRVKRAPDTVLCVLATDATSGIGAVEYSYNGSTWFTTALAAGDSLSLTLRATSNEPRCFVSTIVSSPGVKSVYARATDGAGNLGLPAVSTFTVDDAGPVVALAAGLQSGPQRAISNTVALSGPASDAGGTVTSLTVDMVEETGAATSGAISATLGAGQWQADYPLSAAPHGVYTVTLRATDDVGNVTTRDVDRITIDGFGPLADLTDSGPSTQTLAGTGGSLPAIAGTVADVPYPSNALLHLHFEEPGGASLYADGSTLRHGAVCAGACAQAPGALGQAAQLDNTDAIVVADPLDAATPLTLSGYTLSAWVKPASATGANLIARAASVGGQVKYQVRINDAGRFEHDAFDGIARVITSTTVVVPGGWYHVAAVASSGGEMGLFVNGIQEGQPLSVTAIQGGGDQYVLGGLTPGAAGYYAGLFDEALVYGRALRGDEIWAIARPTASGAQSVEVGLRHVKDYTDDAAIAWYPAAMAQPGQRFSAWSFTLPEGIEGPYDIALRATDGLGNVRTALSAWSGEIDTWAPRVLLTTTLEGGRIRYTTTAQDYNLTPDGFNSACGAGWTTGSKRFSADWYSRLMAPDKGEIRTPEVAALAGKLYELSATCLVDAPPSMAEVGGAPVDRAAAVAAAGNVVYVASVGRGVLAFDVTDPERPIQTGEWSVPGVGSSLYVSGSLLLAWADNQLVVGSIASPTQPITLGALTLGYRGIQDVAMAGQYAYVSVPGGLQVVDLLNPAAPVKIGALNTFPYAFGLAISGTYAFVADFFGGLRIVNIAAPASPVEVGLYPMAAHPVDVALKGGLAYVATDRGLEILDVSNPAAPALVATRDLPGGKFRVVVTGTNVILSLSSSGVVVVDVSDPALPEVSRVFDTPGYVKDVLAHGAYVYVADDSSGLGVLDRLVRPASIAYDTRGNATRLVTSALSKEQLAGLKANPNAPSAGPESLWVNIDGLPPILSGAPYTVTGLASSTNGGSLKAVSVTVDGAVIYSQTWLSGAASAAAWSGAWAPVGEGPHVVSARALDWLGATAEETATLFVDSLAPALTLTTTRFGLSQFGIQGALDLQGTVSDTSGIRDVQVSVGEAQLLAVLDGANGWMARWQTGLAAPPDGLSVPVIVTATDRVGRVTVLSNALILDATGPDPIAVSLSYTNSLGERVALAPGQAIQDVLSPTLLMTWTTADGGGLDQYQAGWTGGFTLTALERAGLAVTPAWDASNAQLVGEARKVYGHVIATDLLGNTTESVVGPVYVDYRRTNDYIRLDDPEGVYRGWQSSGCSLLGADLRISRAVPGTSPLLVAQSLYATWDADALRLAWTGADWDSDGDLFVYLGGPGDSTTTGYNPIDPSSVITLPMQASRLVWVRGADDWSFLNWTGSAWAVLAWPGLGFGFSPDLIAPVTDLVLPFAALGVANPASTTLGVLAMATEATADGLRVWATLPRRNAVNAARVVGISEAQARAGGAYGNPTAAFALALGANQCPQEDVYSGADLGMLVRADPAGQTSAVYEDGWTVTAGNPQSALIGSGDAIVYRFDIVNRGSGPALNASIALTGDQINLGNAAVGGNIWEDSVVLGDIGAGETRTVTVTGSVDLAAGAARGNAVRLDSALVFSRSAYAGDPLARQRAEHRADISPPTHLKLLPGSGLAGTGAQTMQGIVHDAGAVPTVTLEVKAPGGSVVTVDCPGAEASGSWQCGWDAGASPADGSIFELRARATDAYGNVSGWTGWTDIIVDTLPATLTLEADTLAALSDETLAPGEETLDGRLDDNHLASRIEVCDAAGQGCRLAAFELDPFVAQDAFTYDDVPETPVAIGAAERCVIGTPLARTFTVSESFAVAYASLGLNATLPARGALSATLRSPFGTRVALHVPGNAAGRDLSVRWDDAAPSALSGDDADHAAGTLNYANLRYPDEALGAFDGEDAAGVWTLSLCAADGQAGAFNGAQLGLARQNTAINRGGYWSNAIALPESADGISETLVLHAYDSLGNATSPMTISYRVDNVSPVLTLTEATATLPFTLGEAARPVLTGTVLDGGGIKSVFVTVRAPSGEVSIDLVSGGQAAATNQPESATPWGYALQPNQSGDYAFLITALDEAENVTTLGPVTITVDAVSAPVLEFHSAFIPIVRNGAGPGVLLPEPETLGPLHTSGSESARALQTEESPGSGPSRARQRVGAWLLSGQDEPLFGTITRTGARHE